MVPTDEAVARINAAQAGMFNVMKLHGLSKSEVFLVLDILSGTALATWVPEDDWGKMCQVRRELVLGHAKRIRVEMVQKIDPKVPA